MATYLWSSLVDEQRIAFNPAVDVLHVDDPSLSAADFSAHVPNLDYQPPLMLEQFGANSDQDKFVVLQCDARTLTQGWTTQFVDAFQVMTFGRPLLHDATGYHVLAQGQRVTLGSEWHASEFAFSVDADPAIAPYLVMTMTHYVLAPDGRVAYVGSQLESRPAIDYSGDKAAGTYTATLTTRGLRTARRSGKRLE